MLQEHIKSCDTGVQAEREESYLVMLLMIEFAAGITI